MFISGTTITGGISITIPPPPAAFTMTAVVSNNQTITLPIKGVGLNANINWGDGNTTSNRTTANPTKTYTTAGNYTIEITGNVPGFGCSSPNLSWLTSITNWGNVGLANLRDGCYGSNITIVPNSIPSTVTILDGCFYNANLFNDSNITTWNTINVTDMGGMFFNANSFNQNIGNWNTSNVTDMSSMFGGARAFNQNIGNWNVSKVTEMGFMFRNANIFNQNIGTWNVSNVTSMSSMFEDAKAFNQYIGRWNVSKVTSMSGMFNDASSFNQDLSGWCVANISSKPTSFDTGANSWTGGTATRPQWGAPCIPPLTMSALVSDNETITLPINGVGLNANIYWGDGTSTINRTSNNPSKTYTTAGNYTIEVTGTVPGFGDTNNKSWLTSITNFGNVGLSNLSNGCRNSNITIVPNSLPTTVTNLNSCFVNATQFNDSNITTWNTGSVTNMGDMFNGASSFNRNIGSWSTGKVTDMSSMFSNATSFNQNIGGWRTSNVSNMNSMFSNATSFNANLANWCVANISTKPTDFDTNANSWTGGTATRPQWGASCIPIFTMTAVTTTNSQTITLPIYGTGLNANINWGDGNTTSNRTTANPTKTYTTAGNYTIEITGNVPGFGPTSSTNLNWLTSIIDWGNVGLSNLTNACTSNNITIVPNNIPSTVTTLYLCFEGATQFNDSNITTWNTSNVANMRFMFWNADSFNQNIANWNTSKVTDMIGMFQGADNFNQNIANWNTSNVTSMSSMFQAATSFNQNIGNWNTSNVTTMFEMFRSASNFNGNIGNWNVSKVTNMANMFRDATSFNQNLSSWCVANISSKPSNFDTNANSWTGGNATRPQWGAPC